MSEKYCIPRTYIKKDFLHGYNILTTKISLLDIFIKIISVYFEKKYRYIIEHFIFLLVSVSPKVISTFT